VAGDMQPSQPALSSVSGISALATN
jgi:hypothetical protein